jgi:hypothetical protein
MCLLETLGVCGVTLLHARFLVPSKLEAAVLEYFMHTVYFILLWVKILERAEDNIKI